MSSGSKNVVVNNLERALSTDINRLQTFKDAALSQLAKWLFGVQQRNTEMYPGFISEYPPGSLDPYQNSVVVNGLMPYPINGTVNLFVTPGLVFMEDPNFTPDQSPYRYVDDPGVGDVGVLNLTPSPGSIRIDVIECSLSEEVLEQSNRDIFNTSTGLFSPALVDKVRAGRLEYRIRTGAAGGGFPGVVSGWLPLAVVSVPSGASTWDDCTIWDVRPLLSASHNAPFIEWLQDTNAQTHWTTATWDSTNTKLRITGKVTTGLGPYNQSGLLGNHPTDDPWIDITNTDNWATGATPIASMPYYLWALTPFGLPGWRKYCGATLSPRRPTEMAGVMSLSPVAPTSRGFPSLAIVPPAATGLQGSTQMGTVVACGMVDDAGIGQPFISDGDWVYPGYTESQSPITTAPVDANGASVYTFGDNIRYPANARGIKLIVFRSYSVSTPSTGYMRCTATVVDTITNKDIAVVGRKYIPLIVQIGGFTNIVSYEFEIPFLFNYALFGTRQIRIDCVTEWHTAAPNSVTETARVFAWKMTP